MVAFFAREFGIADATSVVFGIVLRQNVRGVWRQCGVWFIANRRADDISAGSAEHFGFDRRPLDDAHGASPAPEPGQGKHFAIAWHSINPQTYAHETDEHTGTVVAGRT